MRRGEFGHVERLWTSSNAAVWFLVYAMELAVGPFSLSGSPAIFRQRLICVE